MKQTVTESTFRDAFLSIRPDNFSYSGLQALYDYLTELEEGTGQEMELDVIAICCDYSEIDFDTAKQEYPDILEDCEDLDEVADELSDHTSVIRVDDDKIIIANF